MRKIQVDSSEYFGNGNYDNKARWLGYYYQAKKIMQYSKGSVLEVGVGNSFLYDYLRKRKYDITTVDIDSKLNPDVVADIINLPFEENKFDCSVCFEVLEHLPFDEFERALKEMSRVSRITIISVPDKRRILFSGKIKIPFLKQYNLFIKVPSMKEHIFDGEHYWELGKKKFPLSIIRNKIKKLGLRVIEENTQPDCPSIRYYIMEKNED